MIGAKLKQIVLEQAEVLERVEEMEAARFTELILSADAIYCAGVGRSGYVMRAFAMRLMHCGLRAYVVGDTEAPGAQEGDVLLLGSGSGETESLKAYVAKAKKLGMKVGLVSGFPKSALGQAADEVLVIPAPTPKAKDHGERTSSQPMASLFEQSLFAVLDAVIMEVMEKKGLSAEAMFARHANLE